MDFSGCYCTECLRAIRVGDGITWILFALCVRCCSTGIEGICMSREEMTPEEVQFLHRYSILNGIE